MIADLQPLLSQWHEAFSGMAQPWVIVVVLALTTLLLEDVAIAAGVVLATQGALSWEWSFVAVAGGIALGDLGLYGLGAATHRWPYLRRKYIGPRSQRLALGLNDQLVGAVLLARVVPGLRLVTYTACGFLRIPVWPFTTWVVLAVALWTAGLFWFSSVLGTVIAEQLNIPVAVAVALPIAALAMLVLLLKWLQKTRLRTSS